MPGRDDPPVSTDMSPDRRCNAGDGVRRGFRIVGYPLLTRGPVGRVWEAGSRSQLRAVLLSSSQPATCVCESKSTFTPTRGNAQKFIQIRRTRPRRRQPTGSGNARNLPSLQGGCVGCDLLALAGAFVTANASSTDIAPPCSSVSSTCSASASASVCPHSTSGLGRSFCTGRAWATGIVAA